MISANANGEHFGRRLRWTEGGDAWRTNGVDGRVSFLERIQCSASDAGWRMY